MRYIVYNVDANEVVDQAASLDDAGKVIAGQLGLGYHTLAEFAVYEKRDMRISVEVLLD